MSRGITRYEDPVAEWLKEEYGDYGRATAEYIAKLTSKQRKFCHRYLVHGSPHKAAIEAGFTVGVAAKAVHFVNVPKVAAYLNILAAKREVDLKRASSAEMLLRIKATPAVAADSTRTPEAIKRVTKNLAGGVANLSDDALLGHIQLPEPDAGIMQAAPVHIAEAVTFGVDWVVEQLVGLVEKNLQIVPVFDSKGRPIGEFKFNSAQALAGLIALGKHLAMFTERVEYGSMEQYTGSELDARIKSLLTSHPELATAVAKIDKAVIPKEPKAGQGDPDFVDNVTIPHKLVH